MPVPRRPRQLRPSPRSARQERSRDETRARICSAAMQVFLDEGFERTSMRRIAEAVGYTPGALYSYFRDKDEILYALHLEGFAKLRALVGTIDPERLSPAESLYRLGKLYLRFAFESPQYYELMFITSSTGKRIRELDRWDAGMDNYDRLRGVVRDCIETGVLPPGDVESAAFAIWSTAHGIASLVIRGRTALIFPGEALPRVVAEAYDFALRGLLAQPEGARPKRPGRAAQRTRRR